MLKRLAVLLPLVVLAAFPVAADSVTLSVNAGLLESHTGATLTDGDLILLIASPTGTFGPTVGSEFVSGDNLILGSSTGSVTGAFAMADQNSGTTGETYNTISFDYGVGATGTVTSAAPSIAAGDKVAIRWYDNFTLAQFQAGLTPTSGYYGTYTTLLTADPDGGLDWTAPPSGSVLTGGGVGLDFYTLSDGGTQANIEGEALIPVISGGVAVPEPSTYALLATGLLFVAGMAVRKKRLAVVTK